MNIHEHIIDTKSKIHSIKQATRKIELASENYSKQQTKITLSLLEG